MIMSSEMPAFLPRNFVTSSAVPKKLVSSFVALVRPLDSPESPPWMVLSVEPSKGITQLFNPLTRTPVQNLDLTKFSTTILATECHIIDDEGGYPLFCSGPSFYVKALMFFEPSVPSIENCHLFAALDNGQVYEWQPFDRCHYFQKAMWRRFCYVDDIITYKGNIYALDKYENLLVHCKRDTFCLFCDREYHFCEVAVHKNIDCDYERVKRRRRLVVSSSGETLYMVDPVNGHGKRPSGSIDQLYFRVYKMDNTSKSWCRVSRFEDLDVEQVLFVTRDYCFFVAATEFPGFQLKNCIIFSDDAFPEYTTPKGGWYYPTKGGNEVAIFSLDKDHAYSLPVKSYPGFPVMLWSPPPWILQKASSPQLRSQSEAEQDGMAQSAFDNKHGPSYEDVLFIVDQSDSVVCLAQPSVKEVVTLKKFQGIDVLPDHLPILENIWMKHGDVLEGSVICSRDTKSKALTSLAKIVLILETSSGYILARDQAQYVNSTFSDLQHMRLKVDWLAPRVEKALAIYKREQLMELEKAKAKAEEVERTFLSEMAKYKQRLDKDLRLLSQSMPEAGQINEESGDRLHFLARFFVAAIARLRNRGNHHQEKKRKK